jgi:hypothetical protein
MKINKIFFILGFVSIASLTGCSPEDDQTIPDLSPLVYSEDFSVGAVDNTILDTQGWINFAEVGTAKWKEQVFSGNPYAEFSSFQSGEAINIGWLVSPSINLDEQENETLVFRSSQSFVTSGSNSLEVLISTDFDGTNVTTATWEPVTATLPTTSSVYFEFIKSGEIDLSGYTGNVNIAFKVKGSGTNTTLDGSYQVDDIRVFIKQ